MSETLAAAWHGGLQGAAQYVKSSSLRTAISLAMGFWFSNDFTDPSCIDSGGDAACPCGTPGFWNTNWFSNVRLLLVFGLCVSHLVPRSSVSQVSWGRHAFFSTTHFYPPSWETVRSSQGGRSQLSSPVSTVSAVLPVPTR